MSDEAVGAHMERAITEIVDENHWAPGDYLITAQAVVDEDGALYSWRWAWSPKAPEHTGGVSTPRPGTGT